MVPTVMNNMEVDHFQKGLKSNSLHPPRQPNRLTLALSPSS